MADFTGTPVTLMWEARAAAGRADELLAYMVEHAAPSAAVYGNTVHVVVVIDETGAPVPEPPEELLARPAYTWTFHRAR
ncbi:MAG: hypothetical protein FWD74_04600 [Actinomycetia bacterium]|nr:hypothetical protein [Actinomycetes bacterium]